MYHYVRDTEHTDAPRMHAVRCADFVRQLDFVTSHYEVVGLETALRFLRGDYASDRPLCCLTFDDGLIEHGEFVTDELAKRGIQGLFFLSTACTDRECVLPVHQNHLLMGRLDFADYQSRVLATIAANFPQVDATVEPSLAAKTYRWDEPEVGRLKYLLNYQLESTVRNQVLDEIFADVYGSAALYADKFYLSWDDARSMQRRGMALGGHTHTHPVLANLAPDHQTSELERNHDRLAEQLNEWHLRSFCYPHGKHSTFDDHTISELKRLGYACSFTSEVGDSEVGDDPFLIKRIDPKDLPL